MLFKMLPLSALASTYTNSDGLEFTGDVSAPTGTRFPRKKPRTPCKKSECQHISQLDSLRTISFSQGLGSRSRTSTTPVNFLIAIGHPSTSTPGMFVHAYIHLVMHPTFMHRYIYTQTYMQTYLHTYLHICLHICVCVFVCVRECACVCVHACVSLQVYVSGVCVCACA